MNNNEQNPTTENQGVKPDSVKANETASVEATDNDTNTVDSIPYARFNEVNKKYKQEQADNKALRDEKEKSRISIMEEQGKHKERNVELTTENQVLKDKLSVYAEKEAKEREDLITQLDDQDKEVYGNLTNGQLRKHLAKSKTQPVNTNTTQPIRDVSGNTVKNWSSLSPDEKRSNWKSVLKSYKK